MANHALEPPSRWRRSRGLPGLVDVGGAKGDVTLYQFYDLNCPFCREAAADVDKLIRSDPALRLVFVPYPVLSVQSVEGAVELRCASSAPQQFLEFHRRSTPREALIRRGSSWNFIARSMPAAASSTATARSPWRRRWASIARRSSTIANTQRVTDTMTTHAKLGTALKLMATPAYVMPGRRRSSAIRARAAAQDRSRRCGAARRWSARLKPAARSTRACPPASPATRSIPRRVARARRRSPAWHWPGTSLSICASLIGFSAVPLACAICTSWRLPPATMTAWASSLRSVSSATGLTLRRSAATAGSVALASEYCAVPAAPSISATAAECSGREFRLQAGRRIDHAGDRQHQRIDPQRDLAHRGGIDLVAVADRDHRVDQRMQHHAAGVGLVAVALDQPAVAQALGQMLRLRDVAVDAREALLAFDDLLRANRSRARRAAPPARRSPRPCRRATTCTWCRGSAACRRPGSRRSPSRRSASARRDRAACRRRRPPRSAERAGEMPAALVMAGRGAAGAHAGLEARPHRPA